ncbi:hypothetical protein DSECCO2_590560 [anaerobic digester metagenome]
MVRKLAPLKLAHQGVSQLPRTIDDCTGIVVMGLLGIVGPKAAVGKTHTEYAEERRAPEHNKIGNPRGMVALKKHGNQN